jgi:outer membrane protein OmpA-like peptidoglycan-associated protein
VTYLRAGLLAVLLLVPAVAVTQWIRSADARLDEVGAGASSTQPQAAVASMSNDTYCTPELKRILRRVLLSCGLVDASARGCQPVQARNVATLSDESFNALFQPMKDRGAILQFQQGKSVLDQPAQDLLTEVYNKQGGGSWFFVVARASTEGSNERNRQLSKERAQAVMDYLKTNLPDQDLDKEVGLLWLGEEFAQLSAQYCDWRRSSGEACTPEQINRSAFVAWIDCQL